MSDRHDTDADALDEGVLLAAYLDGDTDDMTTRRLERRLAEDARLAARLDAIAETRAQLQRLDDVRATSAARQRVKDELARHRETPEVTRAQRPATLRWVTRFAPLAAAAAVAVIAVLGLATVLPALSGGDSAQEESGAQGAAEEGGGVDAGGDDSDDGADGGLEAAAEAPQALSEESSGRSGSETAADATAVAPPATVTGDADIVARAERLRDGPSTDLRRRERRLRRDAALPAGPTCVDDVDAATVDLIVEDGRTALAVLLDDGSGQIVMLDPTTCAPIRMISTD
ncbi:MAG: hypothetical protein KY460_00200 [Actinobacteria bacterium]|nr:hypothetical protein [Actinomycetota bacterium]